MGILDVVLRGRSSHNPRATNVVAHYTQRAQPNPGGALVNSYDNLELPITQVIGLGVAVNTHTRPYPVGQRPLVPMQQQIPFAVADNAFGQLYSQPLVDPNSPSRSGIDRPLPGTM